ncbi:MAG: hypothetical protein GJ676_05215 [Rhodobacteraceae bacterium]|nr:hypothetical protein [Paracoccaceae bacterium]
MLPVTALYAGLIALLFVVLSIRVILFRRTLGASVGDIGDKNMLKAIRTQANCAEYAPFALLLMAILELQDGASWALHALGLMLLVGRLAHAYGFGRTPQIIPLRQVGMVLTFSCIILSGFGLIGSVLF